MRVGYTPPPVYEPNLWALSSHDRRYTERISNGTTCTTSTAWVAGLAVYVPFVIDVTSTVYEWFYFNGTLTTAHNFDVGIYRTDFTKIQSLGSTAGLTVASALNLTTTWTDLVLNPGTYYMAFCNDSTRAFTCSTDAIGAYQVSGIMEQTGLSSTLPSPAVPVKYARAFLPFFGMNLRSVAI